jgi:hypothetical protein
VRRHAHNDAGAIVGKNVVGYENRDMFARQRIGDEGAQGHTRLFIRGRPRQIALPGCGFAVLLDRCALLRRDEIPTKRPFRRNRDEAHARQRFGAGGVRRQHGLRPDHGEFYLQTFRTADPVALSLLDALWPI